MQKGRSGLNGLKAHSRTEGFICFHFVYEIRMQKTRPALKDRKAAAKGSQLHGKICASRGEDDSSIRKHDPRAVVLGPGCDEIRMWRSLGAKIFPIWEEVSTGPMVDSV